MTDGIKASFMRWYLAVGTLAIIYWLYFYLEIINYKILYFIRDKLAILFTFYGLFKKF